MAEEKILYKGNQEIEGSILEANDKVVVIQLKTGGTIVLEKDDVFIEPVKKAKKGRRAKKKEDMADVEQSEEQ